MPRLPQPGGDAGNWGQILNDYLSVEHNTDGSLKNAARPDDVNAKYTKPGNGIPKTDLEQSTQDTLDTVTTHTTDIAAKANQTDLAATNTRIDGSLKADGTLRDSSVTRGALGADVAAALGKPITTIAPVIVPEAWYDAAIHADGALPAMTDTGQPIKSFGNSPFSQSGGALIHAPQVSSNVAAYLQIEMTAPVVEFGVVGHYPSKGTGGVTGAISVVLPKSDWEGNLGTVQAGVHYVQYAGAWHVSNWSGSGETPMYIPDTPFGGSGLPVNTLHVTAFRLDRAANTLKILLPTGQIVTASNALVSSNTGRYVVAELFESVNTLPPARINAVWGDSAGLHALLVSRSAAAQAVHAHLLANTWFT